MLCNVFKLNMYTKTLKNKFIKRPLWRHQLSYQQTMEYGNQLVECKDMHVQIDAKIVNNYHTKRSKLEFAIDDLSCTFRMFLCAWWDPIGRPW